MSFNFGNYGMYSLLGGSSSSSFYNSLGDYASIRSGNYKRLLTAYYAKTKSSTVKSSSGSNSANRVKNPAYQNMWNSNSYYSYADKAISAVKNKTDELTESAGKLTATGSKSLFNEKVTTTTDAETGVKTTTRGYDVDAIAKAVKSFVADYNSVVETGLDSSSTNVVRNTQYMTRMSAIYKNSLSEVGITIGKDNTLSVDEEKLKAANVDSLKRVFNGSTSYAALTANRSTSIGQAAARAVSTANTYGSTGSYSMFNSYMSAYNWYL